MKKRFYVALLAAVLAMSNTLGSLAAVEGKGNNESHFLKASISADQERGLEGAPEKQELAEESEGAAEDSASGEEKETVGEKESSESVKAPSEGEKEGSAEDGEKPSEGKEEGSLEDEEKPSEGKEEGSLEDEEKEPLEGEKPSEGEEKPSDGGEEEPSEGVETPSEGEEEMPSEGEEETPSEGEEEPAEGEEEMPSEGGEEPAEGEEETPSEGGEEPAEGEEETPSEGGKEPAEGEEETPSEGEEKPSEGQEEMPSEGEEALPDESLPSGKPGETLPSGEVVPDSSANPGAETAESQKAAAMGFQDFDMYGTDPYMTLTFDLWDKEVPEFPETLTLLMEDETTREIKAVWKSEDDFLNTDLEEYVYTLELPKGIRFAGQIEEDLESGQASLPWIAVVPEEGIMTYALGSLDISSLSFPVYDVRTPSKKMNFDGGDGKNAVIVFGGIGSCSYTKHAIGELAKLPSYVDMDALELYVFDIQSTPDRTIISQLSEIANSGKICVNSIANSKDYETLFRRIASGLRVTSFTMPLIAYKDGDGEIYQYSTGPVELEDIVEALENGGIDSSYGEDVQTLTISGQNLYSEAFDVLSIVNQQRAVNGLSALTMDKRLMEAAMNRAAECALYYSHTRPTGKSCISIIDTMHAENIAAGFSDAYGVMNGWMNSSGHRANILGSCHESIGVGCFRANNRLYWVQVFGDAVEEKASKPSDRKRTYDIQTSPEYVTVGFWGTEKELYTKETFQLQVYAGESSVMVEPSTYRWSSSAPSVAAVDSTGKVTAASEGSAVVVAANRFNPDQTLEFTVTVKDLPGPDVNKIVNTVSGTHVYWYAQDGARKYYVYRAASRNGEYKKIKETTATHYTDTAVNSGTTYFYKISSVKGTRETAMSEAIGITYVETPDLTLRVNRSTGIGLGWNKITGATGYGIYRKTTGDWVRVATISGNSTFTWTDTSARSGNGTVYRYTIRALAGSNMKTLSGCRNTGRTMVRLFTPTLNNAAKAGATSLKAAWNRNGAATGYEVRLMVGNTVYKTYTYGNNSTIAKTITGLPKGRTYKVQVRSYKKVPGVGSFYSAWSAAKNVTL